MINGYISLPKSKAKALRELLCSLWTYSNSVIECHSVDGKASGEHADIVQGAIIERDAATAMIAMLDTRMGTPPAPRMTIKQVVELTDLFIAESDSLHKRVGGAA